MIAADLAVLKAARPLAEIVARYADGQRRVGGRSFWLCPFHAERTPSFTITPDGGAFVCFGCGAKGDVIDFVMHAESLDFKAALEFLGGHAAPTAPAKAPSPQRHEDNDLARRIETARAIWREAVPAEGTPVERYLRGRGITLEIPPTIRHHPTLFYAPAGLRFHGMVAAVQALDGRILGVHRTYLLAEGRKAGVASPKMMLGQFGGAAVRLGPAGERLIVAEGLETALCVMQATGTPAWAALSAPGLRSLTLPPMVREVTIAADGDPPGEEAAQAAAAKWTGEGRKVRIARPPDGFDFNDVLSGKCTGKMEATS